MHFNYYSVQSAPPRVLLRKMSSQLQDFHSNKTQRGATPSEAHWHNSDAINNENFFLIILLLDKFSTCSCRENSPLVAGLK